MGLPQKRLEVKGTGSYLPEQIVKTEEFAGRELWAYDSYRNRVGEATRFTFSELIDRTGIYERRKSRKDEWPSDMGYVASIRALETAKVDPKSLAGIIVATVSEKKNFPSAAAKIQRRIGAEKATFSPDVQGACAGFPLALTMADALYTKGNGDYWLVVASECLTKVNDLTDRNSHLFGDGAGAVVLGPSTNGKGIVGTYNRSEPFDGGEEMIFRDTYADCIRMPDGRAVLRRAVDAMTQSVISLKEKLGWERADVYIPHQANERIIAGVENKLKGDGAVVYRNISKYGNMSAATCAVALDEALREGVIKEGHKVIITSFGAGLVTSAVAVQF